jgi:hypothetical protein
MLHYVSPCRILLSTYVRSMLWLQQIRSRRIGHCTESQCRWLLRSANYLISVTSLIPTFWNYTFLWYNFYLVTVLDPLVGCTWFPNLLLNCFNFPWVSDIRRIKCQSSWQFIYSSRLSYDRSKTSSKTSSPHSAIQSFLLQMRESSPFLKVIQ